jgi:nucleoside-diphosphate-sugar epimerase
MNRALVFGASGQLGLAVIRELLAQGWAVTAVAQHRAALVREIFRSGVQTVEQEKRSRSQLLPSLGHTFDAVFDPTCYTADDAVDLLREHARFGSLVTVSSCSVYADAAGRSLDEAADTGFPEFGAPMSEGTATVAAGKATYSTRKVAMEHVFRDSNSAVTILRPCAIHGPHATHPREWWLVKRALDGRKHIPISYDGDSMFHTSSAQGIASLAVLCMERPATRVLNVADPRALTVKQIAKAIEAHLGKAVPLQPFAGPPNGSVGASPWSTPRPYVLDCRVARALGWDGGPKYEAAVKPTLDWLLDLHMRGNWMESLTGFARYAHDPFDYAAEDEWLAKR